MWGLLQISTTGQKLGNNRQGIPKFNYYIYNATSIPKAHENLQRKEKKKTMRSEEKGVWIKRVFSVYNREAIP